MTIIETQWVLILGLIYLSVFLSWLFVHIYSRNLRKWERCSFVVAFASPIPIIFIFGRIQYYLSIISLLKFMREFISFFMNIHNCSIVFIVVSFAPRNHFSLRKKYSQNNDVKSLLLNALYLLFCWNINYLPYTLSYLLTGKKCIYLNSLRVKYAIFQKIRSNNNYILHRYLYERKQIKIRLLTVYPEKFTFSFT